MLHKIELHKNLTSHNQMHIMFTVTSENTKPDDYLSFLE